MTTAPNLMREQIMATPAALADVFDELELRARLALPTPLHYRTRRVVLTGSGDSAFAASAAESCFWVDAGLGAEWRSPLTAGRYLATSGPTTELAHTLLVALSNSGGAARVAEATTLFHRAKAMTLGVTANPDGRLAALADHTLVAPVPSLPSAPGYGPFLFALLSLELFAIRMGEVRMHITMDEAQSRRAVLKARIRTIGDLATAIDARTAELAETLAPAKLFEFLGAGPNTAIAEYGAAKLLEASGRHALARDTEEWAHLNYFDAAPEEIATIVIAPAASVAQSRTVELLDYLDRLGRKLLIIGGGEAAAKAAGMGHPVISLPEGLPERWTPPFAATALALFAAHLSARDGAEYGRGGKGPWASSAAAATVQQSAIWEADQ